MRRFYMVFWIAANGVSRSGEIASYYEAVDVAKTGPSGSRFDISYTDMDAHENDRLCLTGYVA